MIFTVAVLAALLLAFALPSLMAAHERRGRGRQLEGETGEPDWWSEFERGFRAYVRQLELGRGRPNPDPGTADRQRTRRPRPD